MKILIADSGSTKTQWAWCNTDTHEVVMIPTRGLNPVLASDEDLEDTCNDVLDCLDPSLLPESVFFYGAGCAGGREVRVHDAIAKVFKKASTIEVAGDMLGACRSLLGNKPGIACILGTGSNCCYYNGKKIVCNAPSLGYILGDEGSGSFMGKHLLADYFKGLMPMELRTRFQEQYADLTLPQLIEHVYRKPQANKFVAGFTPFLLQNIDDPFCKGIVRQSFLAFLTDYVLPLRSDSGREDLSVGFVGSIAQVFERQLRKMCDQVGVAVSEVRKSPMAGLIDYHCGQGMADAAN